MGQRLLVALFTILLVCSRYSAGQGTTQHGLITVRQVQTSIGGSVYVLWSDVEMNGKKFSVSDAIVFACLSKTPTCKKPLVDRQFDLHLLAESDPASYKRGTVFSISGTGIGRGKPGIGKIEESYKISDPDGWEAVYFLADYQPDTAAITSAAAHQSSTVAKSDLQILTVRKHFLTSNMFEPVLTVFNKGGRDLGVNVDWYATDDGVDVARGSCFAHSVRPGTKAELNCGPYVMDHPNAQIKLGELFVQGN